MWPVLFFLKDVYIYIYIWFVSEYFVGNFIYSTDLELKSFKYSKWLNSSI